MQIFTRCNINLRYSLPRMCLLWRGFSALICSKIHLHSDETSLQTLRNCKWMFSTRYSNDFASKPSKYHTTHGLKYLLLLKVSVGAWWKIVIQTKTRDLDFESGIFIYSLGRNFYPDWITNKEKSQAKLTSEEQ